MTDFGKDQFFHREFASAGRAGQRHDEFPLPHSGDSAARECGRSDFIVREHPEQLAESRQFDIEQLLDHIGGAVARGDAGPAGDDDRIQGCEVFDDRARDTIRVIGHDRAHRHAMPRGLEHLRDQVSTRIVVGRSRVAARQNTHLQISPRLPFVFLYTHSVKLYITGTFRKA